MYVLQRLRNLEAMITCPCTQTLSKSKMDFSCPKSHRLIWRFSSVPDHMYRPPESRTEPEKRGIWLLPGLSYFKAVFGAWNASRHPEVFDIYPLYQTFSWKSGASETLISDFEIGIVFKAGIGELVTGALFFAKTDGADTTGLDD